MNPNGLYTSEPILHIYGEIFSYYSDLDQITETKAGNCPFCKKLYSPVIYQNKLYGLKEFSKTDIHYPGETLFYTDTHTTFIDIVPEKEKFVSAFESIFERSPYFFFLQDDLHLLLSVPREIPSIIEKIPDFPSGESDFSTIGEGTFLVHTADNLGALWDIFHDNYFLNGNCSFLAFRREEPNTYYIVMARSQTHKIIFFRSDKNCVSEFKQLTVVPRVSYHKMFLEGKIKPSIIEEFKYIPKFDSQLCNSILSRLFSERIENIMKLLRTSSPLIDTETINNLFRISKVFGQGKLDQGMAVISEIGKNNLVVKYVPSGFRVYISVPHGDTPGLSSDYIDELAEAERETEISLIVNKVRDNVPNFTRLFSVEICPVLLIGTRDREKGFPLSVCCPTEPRRQTTKKLFYQLRKIVSFSFSNGELTTTKKKLLYEELAVGKTLTDIFMSDSNPGFRGFLEIFYQILFTLIYSQKKINFHHLDLHWNNIIVRELSQPIVFRYVIPGIPTEKTTFPSRYLATIIDYGRSYAESDGKSYVPSKEYLHGEMIDGYDLHTFMIAGLMFFLRYMFEYKVKDFSEELFNLYFSMSKIPFPEKIFEFWRDHRISNVVQKPDLKYCCETHKNYLALTYTYEYPKTTEHFQGYLDLRKPVKGIFPTEEEFFLQLCEKFPISPISPITPITPISPISPISPLPSESAGDSPEFMMEWGDVDQPGKITPVDSP